MKMRHYIILSLTLVLCCRTCLSQRGSLQSRYLRPPSQSRPCVSCPDDKPRDPYVDDEFKDPKKDDGWSGPSTGSRPGSDYKPKPDYDDSYRAKPVSSEGGGGSGGYITKPREEYRPKPKEDDYYPKPVDEVKTDDRDDYKPKPAVRDDYVPKPVVRDDYVPKPADRDDYVPKPAVRDDYVPKPAVRDDYETKPVVRDEYVPKPAVRDDYGTKPVVRDDYVPKPAVRDDYGTKPVIRDEYVPKPAVRDEYVSKPAVRDDYVPKPVVRDDYGSKPVVRDDYIPRPVDRDEKPKPVDRVEYDSKPLDRDDYGSRPVVKDDYVPKPVVSGSGYQKPAEPAYGGAYPSRPYPGDNKDSKVDTGIYDEVKDDDYNDYKPGDDIKEPEVVGKPMPVIENDNCICVPYYQCKDGHIVTDGAGIIDARRRPQPDEELPLDGKFKPPSCGPFHVCCNTPESSTVKPYEHRCGVRNPSGINSRILSPSNRGEADFGEWPWQAAVLKSEGTVNIFQCGGVLIDKYHVLTVAHCVFHLYKYNEYPLKVRLGEWDTQTTSEFLAHEDYKVSKITIHPEYRNTSLWNDIAILRLQEPVLFAPHIDTVCLPKYDEIFAGQNCVVTGWGKDSYKGGTFSNVMKEVALQVIDNYRCEEMLRKTRLGRFFQLHEGFVCAGGEHGLDSCKGDGGGPLVCYRKDRSYALAGLVSWGIDCGQPGVPGVYVKVQKYLDWISKNTGVAIQDYWPKV